MESLEPRRLMSSGLPRFSRVVVVVEENHDYGDIMGADAADGASYFQYLGRHGASFNKSHSATTSSLPSYLAMFSGSTQGISDDDEPSSKFSARSLGGQLMRNGMTFAGFSEGLPGVGSTADSSGDYVRRHNPWSFFADVPAKANQPFSKFPKDFRHLPTVSFVVPNLQHDMHDGSVAQANDWLFSNIRPYALWAKKHNSLLIITWDEGNTGDRIPTIFYGANVRRGIDAEHMNHYKLLRTIEDMYGLSPLAHAAENGPVLHAFTSQRASVSSLASSQVVGDLFSQTSVHKKDDDVADLLL